MIGLFSSMNYGNRLMHDIKFIKENPVEFDYLLSKRNIKPKSNIIIPIYDKYLDILKDLENEQEKRNKISKKIGLISKTDATKANELKDHVLEIKKKCNVLSENLNQTLLEINSILEYIPNLLDYKTPLGKSEDDNKTIKEFGTKKEFKFRPKDHVAILENLDLLDYEKASKLAGARFSVLKTDLAKMHRGLVSYMLDKHTLSNNYKEVIVPELVKSNVLFGTGQLPKFKEDLFKTSKDLWLIPTSEVSLSNLHREEVLSQEVLPLRYTTFTNCFRLEAGSAGIDTKGLIREHQFGKVELVSITQPQDSDEELIRMADCVENILQELGLHYRIIELCSADIGFSSSYTLDFEVWMPGQRKFREVSSCSNCKDFQSRRMKMRYKDIKLKKNIFPHTLNGSGLAVGRVIVAIIENYQQEDGSVMIPKVLQQYMGEKKELKINNKNG